MKPCEVRDEMARQSCRKDQKIQDAIDVFQPCIDNPECGEVKEECIIESFKVAMVLAEGELTQELYNKLSITSVPGLKILLEEEEYTENIRQFVLGLLAEKIA